MTGPIPANEAPAVQALIDECSRQSENGSYTAVTFHIWLSWLRGIRTVVFVVLPIVCGSLATWKLLTQTSPELAALCTLLATVLPVVYRAVKLDTQIESYAKMAGTFTNLRDRFRYCANVASKKPFAEFEAEAKPYFDQMDKARSQALTPHPIAFWLAQRKHKSGDYHHEYDIKRGV
jgi:hypothetical protein